MISVVDLAESGWQVPPGSRLLASFDPPAPADRARELELNTRIRAEMGANAPRTQVLVLTPYDKVFAESSGASTVEVDELAVLQQRGDGYRRVLVPGALSAPPRHITPSGTVSGRDADGRDVVAVPVAWHQVIRRVAV